MFGIGAITTFLSVVGLARAHSDHGLVEQMEFEWNSVRLPYKVSDIMANYIPDDSGDGFVLITGGCDSPKGNERVTTEDDGDLFACFSTTDKMLKFEPRRNRFVEMPSLPHARQRHAAAYVQGHLFVIGGRNDTDTIVPYLDSYHVATDEWITWGQLPADVVTSDLTAWAWQDEYVYVMGGFLPDYTAVGATYRLHIPTLLLLQQQQPGDVNKHVLLNDPALLQPLTASPHPRGDIHGVELYGHVYVAGGITHTSQWCQALRTTERYHVATDTWETLDLLEVGRADMAVAAWNGKIVALGGETKPEDCLDLADPAYGSFPAAHVDVLEPNSLTWLQFPQAFVDERFRFAAVVVPSMNRLYTFGGQLPHDFTCDCFATTDHVGVGIEYWSHRHDDDDGLEGGVLALVVVGAALFVMVLALMVYKMLSNQREGSSAGGGKDLEDAAAHGEFEPPTGDHKTT